MLQMWPPSSLQVSTRNNVHQVFELNFWSQVNENKNWWIWNIGSSKYKIIWNKFSIFRYPNYILVPLFPNLTTLMVNSSILDNSSGILCYCEECPHGKDEEVDFCPLRAGGQCYSAVEQLYNHEKRAFEVVRSFGCFSETEQALLQCKGDLVPAHYGRSIKCCNYTDFCNKNLLPSLPHGISPTPETPFETHIYLLVTLFMAVICLSGLFFFFSFRNRYVSSDVNLRCKILNFIKKRYWFFLCALQNFIRQILDKKAVYSQTGQIATYFTRLHQHDRIGCWKTTFGADSLWFFSVKLFNNRNDYEVIVISGSNNY